MCIDRIFPTLVTKVVGFVVRLVVYFYPLGCTVVPGVRHSA